MKPLDVALEIVAGHPDNEEIEIELPEKVSMKKLNVFSYFEYENWSVGDKAMISVDLLEYNSEQLKLPPTKEKKIIDDSFSIEILLSNTYVDVMWENGKIEKNIKTTDLVSILHIGEQDFLPEDIIQLKDDENKKGFIKSVDSKSKTCKVKWEKEENIEELSIYDIKESKYHQFTLGSVIIVKEKENVQNDNWIGEVIDYENGLLKICWLNGSISNISYDKVIDSESMNEEDDNDQNQNELLDLATQLMNR